MPRRSGCNGRASVIADDSLLDGRNLVAGANEPGYHLRNVNYPRDYAAEQWPTSPWRGRAMPARAAARRWQLARGIEVGHVFKLGTKYSAALGATFLERGRRQADHHGLLWHRPGAAAGLHHRAAPRREGHHLAGRAWRPIRCTSSRWRGQRARGGAAAEALYARLTAAGYEVLYDDRDERAGVKFNDADLIGMPVRLTVSDRTLPQAAVEVKARWEQERRLVPLGELEGAIREACR